MTLATGIVCRERRQRRERSHHDGDADRRDDCQRDPLATRQPFDSHLDRTLPTAQRLVALTDRDE